MTTLKSRLASPSRSQIPPRLAATWTWMTPVYLGAKSTQPAAPSRSAARMPSPQASSQRRWRAFISTPMSGAPATPGGRGAVAPSRPPWMGEPPMRRGMGAPVGVRRGVAGELVGSGNPASRCATIASPQGNRLGDRTNRRAGGREPPEDITRTALFSGVTQDPPLARGLVQADAPWVEACSACGASPGGAEAAGSLGAAGGGGGGRRDGRAGCRGAGASPGPVASPGRGGGLGGRAGGGRRGGAAGAGGGGAAPVRAGRRRGGRGAA